MPRSAASQRHARDARLAAYRQFGQRHGWTILGLHEDLSYRYPVTPLLGARSAQAELALTGRWANWDALVASVLVSPAPAPGHSGRRPDDLVVQLTMLDTGPDPRRFTATRTESGLAIQPITPDAEEARQAIDEFLRQAARSGSFSVGDQLAAIDVEVLHARKLDPHGRELDLEGPLRLLSALGQALS